MFRFPQRAVSGAVLPARTRHVLRRAVLFSAGLALLWLALQLAPPRVPAAPRIEAPEADAGVAVQSLASSPRLFSAGNIVALVLLAGGAGVAFYLRRRVRAGGGAALPLESMGHLSLAPNQQLRLVRCGDDVLLLGVTAGQITLLKAYLQDDFEAASSKVPPGVATTTAVFEDPSFSSLLRQQVNGSVPFQKSQAPC